MAKRQSSMFEFFSSENSIKKKKEEYRSHGTTSVDIDLPIEPAVTIAVEDNKQTCTAECCSSNVAFQPTSSTLLELTKQIRMVGGKQQSRQFQPSWYKDFPWITLCISENKVYCSICRSLKNSKQCLFSKNLEAAFVSDGYNNWKKALQRFTDHQASAGHMEAAMKTKQQKGQSVIAQLNDQHWKLQKLRREMFLKQLSSLQYLLRQGQAIRGHDITEGNLEQLMKLRSDDCTDLKQWLSQSNYTSPDIINECITLMGHNVLRSILKDIQTSQFFAILADETRDISNHEQMTLCIRWVDSEFFIHEDFIGMYQVESTTSASLTTTIKDILLRCCLSLSSCRGQAYDGAANMMGHFNGVGAQIRKDEPKAIQLHCFAHCVNLCLQESAKSNSIVRDSLGVIQELNQLIRNSPKRHKLFVKIKNEISPDATGLRPLCPTRWSVRARAIESLMNNYEALIQTLEEVNTTCNDDYGYRAAGILIQLQQFHTYFGLKLCYLVFSITETACIQLQKEDLTIQEGIHHVEFAKTCFESRRSEDIFLSFYEIVKTSAAQYTSEPCLPRIRRPPRWLDAGSAPLQDATPQDFYRRVYYEVLDNVISSFSQRFSQTSLEIPQRLEKLLLTAANWTGKFDIPLDETVINFYRTDIDEGKLRRQLNLVPDFVREMKSKEEFSQLASVQNVRTLANMMKASPIMLSMFSEVALAIRLLMTIPVTTAAPERSFASLRRLKTYLRSTMTNQRLNNVALVHCHKERADRLNLREIAMKFAAVNENRKQFFGYFS